MIFGDLGLLGISGGHLATTVASSDNLPIFIGVSDEVFLHRAPRGEKLWEQK